MNISAIIPTIRYHYIMEQETDNLIAYFALIASALPYSSNTGQGGVPAIELKMFALDKQYQGAGLSPLLLNVVIDLIEYYAVEYVGAKIILLYSVPVKHVISLYEKYGFQRVDDSFSAFQTNFTQGCIPMYKVL